LVVSPTRLPSTDEKAGQRSESWAGSAGTPQIVSFWLKIGAVSLMWETVVRIA
jgi:hypothetical protein